MKGKEEKKELAGSGESERQEIEKEKHESENNLHRRK